MVSERVQQTLEQWSEDEGLLGELDDVAADALRQWIEGQVSAADALPDDAFQARITEIRAAARAAARSDAVDGAAVTARAAAALAGDVRSAPPRTAAAAEPAAPRRDPRTSPAAALLQAAPPVAAAPPESASQPELAPQLSPQTALPAPPPTIRSWLRRRLAGWNHRKGRS